MTTVAHEDQGDGARTCFVCGEDVPDGEGVHHADLRIVTHLGACDARVHAERLVHDRSARGRWRPRAEVIARLREKRAKVMSLAAWRRREK